MFDRLLSAAPYATIVCWLLILADAIFPGHDMPVPVARLIMTGAIVGTITLVGIKLTVPAADVYVTGKQMGRAEALAELNSPDVVRLQDHMPLRIVASTDTPIRAVDQN